MVLVAYYTGPNAATMARNMCYTIRSRLNLPAYVYVHFDQARKREKEQMEADNKLAEQMMRESGSRPVQLRTRTIRVEQHIWRVDRRLGRRQDGQRRPQCHSRGQTRGRSRDALAKGAITTDTIWEAERDAKGQPLKDAHGEPIYVRRRVKPVLDGDVTHNPAIPQQRAAKVADPILKKFNADEEYSLLGCPLPKTYTLLVKEYTGAAAIQDAQTSTDGGFPVSDRVRRPQAGRGAGRGWPEMPTYWPVTCG